MKMLLLSEEKAQSHADDVRRDFRRINIRKSAGSKDVSSRTVFTTIFNLAQSTVPTCLKKSTIVPIPKTSGPACLNDYLSIARTSIAIKCF